MSEIENLEAEYRLLATKVIYDGFDGTVDPDEEARLEQLGRELIERNAVSFQAAA